VPHLKKKKLLSMKEIKNKLILKSINELFKYSFKIPSYQRGYRWTPFQVEQLLDDILHFSKREGKSKGEFYCLQPIVVNKVNDHYEVIDGQQRITTLYLIIKYLEDIITIAFTEFKTPNLSFDTRKNSKGFLEKIKIKYLEEAKNENIDFFHLSEAFQKVSEWFESDKAKNHKIDFINTLLKFEPDSTNNETKFDLANNVRVIWYETDDSKTNNSIDTFIRLNIGKIRLTNAELIKALLLQKSNFEKENVNLRQLQIASEWDLMEKSLQNDSFWYFIYNENNPFKYENRIEYIFDLLKERKKDSEYYFTFNEFNQDFLGTKNSDIIDEIWIEIKRFYLTLDEWFQDYDLYHLIGFLIDSGEDILSIMDESRKRNKIDFKEEYLQNKIREKVNCSLNEIEYGRDNNIIKRILLLFNIITILETQKSEIRFPFHKYKSEDWDIEHISSQSDKKINPKKRNDWIKDIIEYFLGSNNKEKYQVWLETPANKQDNDSYHIVKDLIELVNTEKIEDAEFDELYDRVRTFFKEDNKTEEKNDISNLALLDAYTNRSYGNSFFPIKRRRIIENDSKGIFVPITTKNVFLKYYSKMGDNLMYWSKKDAEDYFNSIELKLKAYLIIKENNEENE